MIVFISICCQISHEYFFIPREKKKILSVHDALDLVFLRNTQAQAESLLHILEQQQ